MHIFNTLTSPCSSPLSARIPSQLNPSQRAELRAATERFGAQALELARLERLRLTRGGGRNGPPNARGMQQSASMGSFDLSRATSAPHLLYTIGPGSAGTPGKKLGGRGMPPASAGFPQPIYDAWQRGIAIPGMPPPPMPLSPEKKRQM